MEGQFQKDAGYRMRKAIIIFVLAIALFMTKEELIGECQQKDSTIRECISQYR